MTQSHIQDGHKNRGVRWYSHYKVSNDLIIKGRSAITDSAGSDIIPLYCTYYYIFCTPLEYNKKTGEFPRFLNYVISSETSKN